MSNIPLEKLMNLEDGKVLYDDLRQRTEDIVVAQDQTPSSEDTKIWFPETTPSSVQVPSYTEFTEALSALNSKADNDIIAPDYDDLTFPVDPYTFCIHDGVLYLPTQIISESEAWTPAHWEAVTVTDEISGNTEDINDLYNIKYEKPSTGIPASDLAAGIVTAVQNVSGTTPSITGTANTRYICGECSTLDITAPASGDIEVIFDSGTTPTVLTVTPPTGVTAVKWANGFDPTALDANTRYDLIITDGEWGLAASWGA